MSTSQGDWSKNTYDRVAGPNDLSMGLMYPSGRQQPPTSVLLHYGVDTFPGMFNAEFTVSEAQQFAELLRARQPGVVNGIEVSLDPRTALSRSDVLALYFTTGFRGTLRIFLDYATADRLAYQCDYMVNQVQKGASGTP